MKKITRVLAFLLLPALLWGCSQKKEPAGTTLVVGTLNFDGKFSPFFYTNSYSFCIQCSNSPFRSRANRSSSTFGGSAFSYRIW